MLWRNSLGDFKRMRECKKDMERCKICFTCEKVGPEAGCDSCVTCQKEGPCNVCQIEGQNINRMSQPRGPTRGRQRPSWISDLTVFGTDNCNIRCKYCFIYNYPRDWNSENMSLKTGKRMCQWLLGASGPTNKCSIHWFGGEPLVNFDLMKKITLYGNKLFKGTGKTIKWGLTTNLILIDDEVNKFLKKHNYYVLCSIDGLKEGHDKYRQDYDGKGTWDRAFEGLKRVMTWNTEVTIRWTLMPDTTKYLLDGIKFYDKMGVAHIAPEFAYEVKWTKKDLFILHRELCKVIPYLIERAKEDRVILPKPFRDGLYPYFNNNRFPDRCGLGKGGVGVSSTGGLFLCHRFVDQTEHKVGDIWNGIDKKKLTDIQTSWNVNRVRKVNGKGLIECVECPARLMCNGGCIAVNWDMNKNFHIKPEVACELLKIKLNIAGRLLAEAEKEGIADKFAQQQKNKQSWDRSNWK